MFYIALTKMEHQASAISLSFFGNRAFHKQASDLQAANAPLSAVRSFLKTVLFLLFQMCQQHRSRNVPKCLPGTWLGGAISCSFCTVQLTPVWMWTASQNCLAAIQPKITWAGVSSLALQTSRKVLSTIPFLIRLVLHWILPCDNHHAKKFTHGGALLFHTNFAQGSRLAVAVFSVL